MARILCLLLVAVGAACASASGPPRGAPSFAVASEPARCAGRAPQDDEAEFFAALAEGRRPRWEIGQSLLQGFVGVAYPDGVTIDTAGGDPVEIEDAELDNLPLIGGGAQLKLAGDALDFGVEALMSIAFRSNLEAFRVGGGGAVIAFSADVLVLDFFGGPFLSMDLGQSARVWAGAGPLVQFLEYSQEEEDGEEDEDASGFGSGWYTRGGIEFRLPSGTLVGFGVRYSESEVDLDGSFGDFDLEGVQALVTVSRGS